MIRFTAALCALVCVGYAVVVAQEYRVGNVKLASNCEFVPIKAADVRGHHWLCR